MMAKPFFFGGLIVCITATRFIFIRTAMFPRCFSFRLMFKSVSTHTPGYCIPF